MDIRFIGSGEPGENEVCEVFGLSFARDEWVTVPDDANPVHVAKLSANPTFETRSPLDHDGDGRKGGTAPAIEPDKPRRGRPPKASAAE